MTLDDLLKQKPLIVFGFDEQPSSGPRAYEFSELQHPHYRLKLHLNIHYSMMYDDQKRVQVMENISVGLLHAINECFTEQFKYLSQKDEQYNNLVAYIGDMPDPLAIALATFGKEGITHISCASAVHDFLKHNLRAIFANVEPVLERLGGYQSQLKVQVSRVSIHDLLSRKASYPEGPRPSEFGSLEEYIAKSRGEIRIGDIIYGVELTGKHKKSGYGTFTLFGDKSPVQVIVQNSSPHDNFSVQITEKINNNMYRATIYHKIN